jgi:hypothetical protein
MERFAMTKWVCFDEAGAGAVQSAGVKATLRDGDPLVAALREPGNSILIMPGAEAQQLALVSIIKRELPRKAVAPEVEVAKPASRAATGFLGLTDEPEFADEVEKKPWWKRWRS